jgi:hypothetical protein
MLSSSKRNRRFHAELKLLSVSAQLHVTSFTASSRSNLGWFLGRLGDMKLSTNGQKLEFSMKSPVPLAAGQHVVWEEKTVALAFNLAADPADNSVECKCGTKTWTTKLTKPGSSRL